MKKTGLYTLAYLAIIALTSCGQPKESGLEREAEKPYSTAKATPSTKEIKDKGVICTQLAKSIARYLLEPLKDNEPNIFRDSNGKLTYVCNSTNSAYNDKINKDPKSITELIQIEYDTILRKDNKFTFDHKDITTLYEMKNQGFALKIISKTKEGEKLIKRLKIKK